MSKFCFIYERWQTLTHSMNKEEADKERERQYMLAAEADSKDTELKKNA